MKTSDGAELFVKDLGHGPTVVFVHSWGVTNDIWQYQHVHFVEHGCRVVAFDRRGHGRSSQSGTSYDLDRLADDLDEVIRGLDLRDVTLVGHSMGCGEIVRYLSRHGSSRVARVALVAPITPFLRKTGDNPDGVPIEMFEARAAEWRRDFPRWVRDNARPFFAPATSDALVDWGVAMMVQQPLYSQIATFLAMATTDFRPDLAKLAVPCLILQGTADASAPFELTGKRTAALVPHARFIVYDDAPHGLMVTHVDRLNADLEAFCLRGVA